MASARAADRPVRTRVSAAMFRRPWLRAGALLSAPIAWFVLIYLAALVLLFISAFWTVESFTGNLVHTWTLNNFKTLFTVPTYRTIALRTIGIAAAVTVTDALLAVPFAFYAVRIAGKRTEGRPVRGDPDPAVEQLPRARVHLAADPRPGRRAELDAREDRPRRYQHRLLQLGDLDRVQLHLAAVHDPARSGPRSSVCPTPTSRPPRTSARADGGRSARCSCR